MLRVLESVSKPQYTLLVLVVLLVFFISGCGTISRVAIPPQEALVIGGDNQQTFKIKVHNQGWVPIRLAEQLDHGERINLGFLGGGNRERFTFITGSSAVFANVLSDTVYLKLRVTSQSDLEERTVRLQ